MQYFRDTVTGAVFAFEDDVRCEHSDGAWQFFAPGSGDPLRGPYPLTLQPTDDPTPPLYVPTTEDNMRMRDILLRAAADKIGPLQDAVELDVATADEVSVLKAWKAYRVALGRLDLTTSPVQWPEQPSLT